MQPNIIALARGIAEELLRELGITNSSGAYTPGGGGSENELDKYADRMVAYWRCQEASGNLVDAISGLELVPTGTVSYQNAFSNSLDGVGLDAATAKFVVEDTSWAPLGDFTLAFWYQGSARTSGTMLSFSSGSLTNYLYDEDASGLFQYDGTLRRCSGPVSLHDNTAKFIVFQRQGISDSVYGFFNGSLGTLVREGTARELQEYARFSIAAQPPDSDNGQQGFYSHIGMWDINLPPKSVLAAYNSGAGADYLTGLDL